jgi:hypothetical protein
VAHDPQMSHESAIADADEDALSDRWRGWVTPADRKRCTYVTREERPLATAGHAKVTRL